jgi:hypothetical protein
MLNPPRKFESPVNPDLRFYQSTTEPSSLSNVRL